MKTFKHLVLPLLIVIVILISGRLLWHSYFQHLSTITAENGVLDLRDFEFNEKNTLFLNGEWDFYPNELLTPEEIQANEASQSIEVPGNWATSLHPETPSSIGVGTYRLRILLPDEIRKEIYSMHISSIRSASAIYINDALRKETGTVAYEEQEYEAKNLPYSLSFKSNIPSNEPNIIDIVIQVSNFKDMRGAGIVRDIEFGLFDAVQKNTTLSSSLQIVTGSFFLLLALLVILLYFFGMPDKRLLSFATILISSSFLLLMSSDAKVLHLWIPLSYDLSFRIVSLLQIIIALALITTIWRTFTPAFQPLLKVWNGIGILLILFAIIAPISLLTNYNVWHSSYLMVSIVLTLVAYVKLIYFNPSINLFLAFAMLSFTNHLFWWGYSIITGVTLPHYPFDLLLATMWIALTWFKYYASLYNSTADLAKRLQKVDAMKDDFLAATSNQLRTPLQNILNITSAVLQSEDKLSPANERDLQMTLTIGERMNIILNDLLDIVQLNYLQPKLKLEPLAIQNIIPAVQEMIATSIKHTNITFYNLIDDEFPLIMADKNRFIQIIYNLMHNAYQFTESGSITVKATVHEGRAFISIQDTGIGITPEEIQQIFIPYEQLRENHLHVEHGYGLGLNVSQSLMHLHGGKIDVSSTLEEGSCFTIDFALADMTETERTPHVLKRRSVQIEYDIQPSNIEKTKAHILIIDDDLMSIRLMSRLLENEPYHIHIVHTAKDAIEALQKRQWDLVISEVMLANMSGFEVTRYIRERYSMGQLPVLLLTAKDLQADIQEGFRVGANDYVTKPIDSFEFKARVQSLILTKQSIETSVEMESAWLQAQIQPHFLFNTLNTIVALSTLDEERMEVVLQAFMTILHSKFKFKDGFVPILLEEEVQLVESYLIIEQERFGDRLQVKWDVDFPKHVEILPLTIQPLVENAIRHGIGKQEEGGTIHIQITPHPDGLKISIMDDGIGMTDEQVQKLLQYDATIPRGIGMLNTHIRLLRKYNRGLTIQSEPNKGTTVSFILPIDPLNKKASE